MRTRWPTLFLLLLWTACSSTPVAPPEDGGPPLPPAEDGGSVEEDGGAPPPLDGGSVPVDGGTPADGGRDDRSWPAADFSRRVPSEAQDPDLGVNVYFSPNEDTRGVVLRELSATRRKLHAAMFNTRDSQVGYKLIGLHDAGVEVQILWDKIQADPESDGGFYTYLQRAGIDLSKIEMTGAVGASMHDKYAIMDDERLMTGSANWTVSGLTLNAEHILTIRRTGWPAKFEADYQRVKTGQTAPTSYDPDAGMSVLFGPGDHLDDRVIARIRAAQRSIYVAMFDLTHSGIVGELLAARQRGVRVIFVFDKVQAADTQLDERMEDGGVRVVRGTPPTSTNAKIHEKYSVYDDEWVILGSYNFTNLATFYNRENLVELRSPRLANRVTANLLELLQTFDNTYTNPEQPPARYGFTPGSVQVTLEVREPTLRTADALYLGGDAPALGAWNRGEALPMTRRSDGWWEVTVSIPAGRMVEYKYLIKDRFSELHWEGGPKHFYIPVFGPAQQRWADVYLQPPQG